MVARKQVFRLQLSSLRNWKGLEALLPHHQARNKGLMAPWHQQRWGYHGAFGSPVQWLDQWLNHDDSHYSQLIFLGVSMPIMEYRKAALQPLWKKPQIWGDHNVPQGNTGLFSCLETARLKRGNRVHMVNTQPGWLGDGWEPWALKKKNFKRVGWGILMHRWMGPAQCKVLSNGNPESSNYVILAYYHIGRSLSLDTSWI